MKRDLKFYAKLFSSTFTISAFTIGGGYVIIAIIKKKFVDSYHWITEEEMLDFTAIAQSTPGVSAVNASILIGYRLAGFWGALVAILGTILPPMIILSVVSLFYTAFRENHIVAAALKGMQAGVAAVIADVAVSMGAKVVKQRRILPVAVMLAAFIAAYFFDVSIILIILVCGAIGAAMTVYENKKAKKGTDK